MISAFHAALLNPRRVLPLLVAATVPAAVLVVRKVVGR